MKANRSAWLAGPGALWRGYTWIVSLIMISTLPAEDAQSTNAVNSPSKAEPSSLGDAMKFTANIQPVIPISLDKDWNLITRTILPVIYQESRFPGDGTHSGLGDTTQSFFLSPVTFLFPKP